MRAGNLNASFISISLGISIFFLSCAPNPLPSDSVVIDSLVLQDVQKEGLYVKGEKTFKVHCAACHSIRRRIVGPALADVTKKRSMEWLIQFVRNSTKMIKVKKDPDAIQIYKEYDELEQPSFESFSDSTIIAIFYYIDNQRQKTGVPVN